MLKYDAIWTLVFRASFFYDTNSVYRNRLASLLKKHGFEKTGEMTWKKTNATPVEATGIMEKIFEAHKRWPRRIFHIRRLTLQAEPKYKPIV